MIDWLLPHCFALQAGPAAHDAVPFFLFVACSVLAGICTILAGVKLRSFYKRGWLLITSGLLRTIFVFPLGILLVMMIVAGAIEIAAAIRLRKHITGTGFLALAGIASTLFFPGLLFVWNARLAIASRNTLTFAVLGGLTIIFGACSMAFGLTMRTLDEAR